jgi:hypothetical protein
MIDSKFFQKIDYPSLAGFNKVGVKTRYNQEDIYKKVQQIDGKVAYLRELTPLSSLTLGAQFGESIHREVCEIREQLAKNSPNTRIRDLSEKVLDSAVEWAAEEMEFYGEGRKNRLAEGIRSTANLEVRKKMVEFLDEGFVHIDLGADARSLFQNHREEFLEERKQSFAGKKDWRGAKGLDLKKGFGFSLKKILQEKGVNDLMSLYKREKMVLYYIGLDYSHERQVWYRDCYADSGLPTAKTTYSHFDAGQAIPKMMAYLSDVTEETGPFTVVRQSNLVEKSFFLGHLHAAMDRILWGTIEKPAEDTYYRPPFKHQREVLLSFPRAFQGTTHFGDDLADGSEGSNELLKYTEPIVGCSGTACVFDGYRTIHSGGLVRRGERLALQIAFQPARNLPTRWEKIQKKLHRFRGTK